MLFWASGRRLKLSKDKSGRRATKTHGATKAEGACDSLMHNQMEEGQNKVESRKRGAGERPDPGSSIWKVCCQLWTRPSSKTIDSFPNRRGVSGNVLLLVASVPCESR